MWPGRGRGVLKALGVRLLLAASLAAAPMACGDESRRTNDPPAAELCTADDDCEMGRCDPGRAASSACSTTTALTGNAAISEHVAKSSCVRRTTIVTAPITPCVMSLPVSAWRASKTRLRRHRALRRATL